MVYDRQPAVQTLIDAHRSASQALPDGQSVKAFFAKCHQALEKPGQANKHHRPQQLAVCQQLAKAVQPDVNDAPVITALCAAFDEVSKQLNWRLRTGLDDHNPAFINGHGNAVIIGPGGLEAHSEVLFGVSLVGPGVTYGNHQHPPEEGYLVINDGAWRQQNGAWQNRRRGQTVHNPGNIVHAMRAHESTPLLALWMLWRGD
jgi:quercetin dioxygenase-like cupin family protein